MPANEELIVFT